MKKYVISALAFLLCGCGETTVKETLGIDRRAPDEFRVVSRPPLSVPPQFDLRPPSAAGVDNPGQRDKAQSILLEGSVAADTSVKPVTSKTVEKPSGSAADNGFLQKAGAASADPNVKQELAEKRVNEQLKKEEKGWWSSITGTGDSKEPVVKPEGESERLKKNKAEGKAVTEGETPESGGGTMSTLERWFGSW